MAEWESARDTAAVSRGNWSSDQFTQLRQSITEEERRATGSPNSATVRFNGTKGANERRKVDWRRRGAGLALSNGGNRRWTCHEASNGQVPLHRLAGRKLPRLTASVSLALSLSDSVAIFLAPFPFNGSVGKLSSGRKSTRSVLSLSQFFPSPLSHYISPT